MKYKISVLPDEAVVDMCRVEPNQILVCCKSGAYVILSKTENSLLQDIWRFKGFSGSDDSPPKCLLPCGGDDPAKVIVVEHNRLVLIDIKRKTMTTCAKDDFRHVLAAGNGL